MQAKTAWAAALLPPDCRPLPAVQAIGSLPGTAVGEDDAVFAAADAIRTGVDRI